MSTKGMFKKKLRARAARAAVALGAVAACMGVAAGGASAIELDKAEMSYTQAESSSPLRQAGAHPDITTTFAVKPTTTEPSVILPELAHRFEVDLTPGLLANAAKLPTCALAAMKAGPNGNNAVCPVESQIGTLAVPGAFPIGLPLYNIDPPKGSPALFGSNVLGTVVLLKPSVRPGDYGVTFDSGTISQGFVIREVITKFWGVPADPVHNPTRVEYVGGSIKFGKPSTAPRQPLTLSPTSCTTEATSAEARLDGWESIGQFDRLLITHDALGEEVKFTGCDQLGFTPTVEAKPTTTVADSPSGLDVSIKLPQNEDPDGYAEAHLRDVVMTLPKGMTVNPSSANGLGTCSIAQIGLETPIGATPRFNGAPASCPPASKLGTVRVDTALLANPMPGEVYLAQPHQNPFGSLLALYIAIDDPQSGIRIKLPGEVKPNPADGQLEVSFKSNPQLPFEEFAVSMFTGPRAALKTPANCGTHTTSSSMVPWSSPAGATKYPTNSYAINQTPNGGVCPGTESSAPNTPSFQAGTVDPTAGAHSPFVLKVNRADGTQPIKQINAALPKGLLARLAGIPYCPDAALAVAATRSGRSEQVSGSCPAASLVGSVDVAAGAGSTPFHAAGYAFLAGPYKGAPLSLAIITPAVAGPFDLGTVVVRTALNVNPATTEITAVSDAIPSILQGIPLDIRSIVVDVNRPSFTLNPTSCNPLAVNGSLTTVFNQVAAVSSPFQVGGCGALGFKPRLRLALKGGTKRARYQRLTATLKARPGDANIGRAAVTLPRSAFLAQEHIRTICTRPQWAADSCPRGSIYGKATAWSPLLDAPLSGNVYLRSSDNTLPDLVADLRGQIRVELVGRIDSHKRGIRTTFETVPDAPVSRFVLRMRGGKKSLIVNSRNLCKSKNRADVRFDAQNGKIRDSTPVVTNSCKKKHKKKGARKSKRAARRSGR